MHTRDTLEIRRAYIRDAQKIHTRDTHKRHTQKIHARDTHKRYTPEIEPAGVNDHSSKSSRRNVTN